MRIQSTSLFFPPPHCIHAVVQRGARNDVVTHRKSVAALLTHKHTRAISLPSHTHTAYTQLFRMVDKMTLTRIANQLRPVDFKAGQFVLRAGEAGDSMYFINSGETERVCVCVCMCVCVCVCVCSAPARLAILCTLSTLVCVRESEKTCVCVCVLRASEAGDSMYFINSVIFF